jgi:ribosomal protein L12E/L44/L45/RPP1/RPP2
VLLLCLAGCLLLLQQLPSGNNNASYSLRQIYQKYLLPYEEYEAERLRREMDAAAADENAGEKAAAAAPAPAAAAGPAAAAAAAADKRARSPDAEEPPAKKQKKPKVRHLGLGRSAEC